MADLIGDTFGGIVPSVSMDGVMSFGAIFVGIILFACVGIFLFFYINDRVKYNKKIKLFRKVGKSTQFIGADKGWLCRLGMAGDTWMKVKKFKKTLPRPRFQMGPNEFWYFEREDGEWINFNMGSIDEDMKKAGIEYVDEDMRLQRLGIYKNLEARFRKQSFMEKYGAILVSFVYILITSLCLVILFQRMNENFIVVGDVASQIGQVAQSVDNMMIRSGSGMQEVPFLAPIGYLLKRWIKWD